MARLASPHDKLFKEAFASPQAVRGLLKSVLPPTLLAQLDLSTVSQVSGTFLDEALASSQSDLLFSVKLKGTQAFIFILVEHKSEVDRWVLVQVLRYLLGIWEAALAQKPKPATLPFVIPIIVYNGEARWTAPLDFSALFAPDIREEPALARLTPRFECLIDELGQTSDEELLSRAMGLFASLAAIFLRDARTPERVIPMLIGATAMLGEIYRSQGGGRAVGILLKYLSVVAQLDKDEIAMVVEKHLPEGKNLMMTIAEQYRLEGEERGLEKGLEKGLERGRREERLRTFRKLLALKFGALDESTERRLVSFDDATLDLCLERVLTTRTLEEVLAT